ncbi:ATP-dependent helicase GTA, partial [Hyphodiscus hymeniophilus]
MYSLKRILNDSPSGASGQDLHAEHQVRNGSPREFLAQSEIPALIETSWDGLWSSILSSDFLDVNGMLGVEMDGAIGTSIHNVEEGIESWATEAMPLTGDLSYDSQATPSESFPPDSITRDPAYLCYGMIYRTAVRVRGNMLEIDAKLIEDLESRSEDSCTFSIPPSSTEVVLCFPNGMEFGVLNTHASKALRSLVQRPSLQLEAIADITTIRETIGRVTKATDAVVRVNINVYGLRESCQEVGRYLSSQKLYLQRPDKMRTGSAYENPQVLSFADMQISSYENQFDVRANKAPKLDDAAKFSESISNVYLSLTRSANLSKIQGDRRLKRTLLPHQEEALDFMLQRENGPIPPEFRLWKAMEGENEGWYLHAVTKARNRILASETGGGILADEMGMGKSLSTLALITKTLDKAYDWVVEKKASPDSHILINEWFHEIDLHLDGTLTTLRYHGPKRKTLMLEDADIVLTTYHTIVSDFGDKSSPLHAMEWYRVVLDEAHIIRRQVTTFFRAVTEVKARSRWCLTGTPIQNKLEDIGSLFAFIRAHPFHSVAMFRRFVAIPFDESVERRELATKNLTLLLDSLCLRRSREFLHLPTPEDRVRILKFSPAEREQYEQTKKIMNRALRQKASESYSKSIFGMFQVQLQLRILCNHDLIERHLRKENIPHHRIDGDSPLTRRQRILDEFSSSSAIPVLIMTTGTGAFGLNLTTANRVFIIEPQWNPSVEIQAVSRAIRMNQKNSVLVTRYMIEASVEQ